MNIFGLDLGPDEINDLFDILKDRSFRLAALSCKGLVRTLELYKSARIQFTAHFGTSESLSQETLHGQKLPQGGLGVFISF